MYQISTPIGLQAGETYIVNWNGVEYSCICQDITELTGGEFPALALGNVAFFNGEEYMAVGEPFLIAEISSELADFLGAYGIAMPMDMQPDIPFTIYHKVGEIVHLLEPKYLPNCVPYVRHDTLLRETTATEGTDPTYGKCWTIMQTPIVEVGNVYRIKYNGIVYDCECMAVPAGMFPDPNAVCLGNVGQFTGGDDTGEPFAMMITPANGRIVSVDLADATEVKIEISKEVINPIDLRCLPEGIGSGDVGNQIEAHNTSAEAHSDIRSSISNLSTLVGGTKVSEQISTAIEGLATETYVDNAVAGLVESAPETLNTLNELAAALGDDPNFATTITTELGKKPGKIVAGETFVVDNVDTVADKGAEIFNDYAENIATGLYAHAEGRSTEATGHYAHAEGHGTKATNYYAHAEGNHAKATGQYSHAEGDYTTASGSCSHAEGEQAFASGSYSHAEGYITRARGVASHVEGYRTQTSSDYVHVQGKYNDSAYNETYAHIVGNGTADDARSNAHTLDWDGNAWFAGDVYVGSTSGINKDEGSKKLATEEYVDTAITGLATETYVDNAVAGLVESAPETLNTLNELAAALGDDPNFATTVATQIGKKPGRIVAGETLSDKDNVKYFAKTGAEIFNNTNNVAAGNDAHAEGCSTVASGSYSHAEGHETKASGSSSHAEGDGTAASGVGAHSEGLLTSAIGMASHAEGSDTIAQGSYSHAEGCETEALGYISHVEGHGTIAHNGTSNQHVQGTYNVADANGTYAHIVGNGHSSKRSNAHTLDWDGNAWFSGDVYVGSTSGTNKDAGSKKLVAAPTNAAAGDLLMYDGTNWTKISKADLIAEIIAALPSAEEASF